MLFHEFFRVALERNTNYSNKIKDKNQNMFDFEPSSRGLGVGWGGGGQSEEEKWEEWGGGQCGFFPVIPCRTSLSLRPLPFGCQFADSLILR